MAPSDITEIVERLTRIETKLDALGDHESRIRRLELWNAGLTSLLALALTSVPIIVAVVR